MDAIKNNHILLDSCIISYLLSEIKDLASETESILQLLISNNNKLYISELTYYEILKDIPDQKRDRAEKNLTKFAPIEINIQKLNRASILYSKYKNHPQTKNILNGICDIDIMIGSLIFTEQKPLLLTANYKDFPRPFFKEKAYKEIIYKGPHGQKICIYFYLLEANLKAS